MLNIIVFAQVDDSGGDTEDENLKMVKHPAFRELSQVNGEINKLEKKCLKS